MAILSQNKGLKGFSPVLQSILAHNTGTLYQAYTWQCSHPLRLQLLSKFHEYTPIAFATCCLHPSICTLNAYNVFSIIAESGIQTPDFSQRNWKLFYEIKGLDNFENTIHNNLSSEEPKGIAFLCGIGTKKSYLHEFVLEGAPDGTWHIYQSYLWQYSLEQSFQDDKGIEFDTLKEQLSRILSKETSESERKEAFAKLFHGTPTHLEEPLEFSFVPMLYDPNRIPEAPPQPKSLFSRIADLWNYFFGAHKIDTK